MADSIIRKKSLLFAIAIIKVSRSLIEKKEYVFAKQLLRAGTSIGANAREGLNAPTRKDFIYKFSICQKECDETLYWLELLHASNLMSNEQFESLHKDATSMLKMIKSIIITSRENSGNVGSALMSKSTGDKR